MALTIGTNCGFCAARPSGSTGASPSVIDETAWAIKDTSPSTAIKVTEIGWYCASASEETNYEIAIYSHDSVNDCPQDVIGRVNTNAKGTDTGWKYGSCDIDISSSTVYWIAVQVDATTTGTNCQGGFLSSCRRSIDSVASTTTLQDPWAEESSSGNQGCAIYAIWEAPPPSAVQINIGDAWKSISAVTDIKINIGDTWKTVSAVQVNIGDVWKTVY
jgi:hypothetical protein